MDAAIPNILPKKWLSWLKRMEQIPLQHRLRGFVLYDCRKPKFFTENVIIQRRDCCLILAFSYPMISGLSSDFVIFGIFFIQNKKNTVHRAMEFLYALCIDNYEIGSVNLSFIGNLGLQE